MIYQERIIRLPECTFITGRSAASISRDEARGAFPARVRLGVANAVGWKLSAVMKWINDCEIVTSDNCKQVAPGAKRGRKPRNEVPQ